MQSTQHMEFLWISGILVLQAFLRQAQHYNWLPPTSPRPATKKLKDFLEESIMTTRAIWMPLAFAWPRKVFPNTGVFFFSDFVFLQLVCIHFSDGAKNATEVRLRGKAMTWRGKTAFPCGNTLIFSFGAPEKRDFFIFLRLKWRANLVWLFRSALSTQFFAIHSESALSCSATHDCAPIHTCLGWLHGSFSKRGSQLYRFHGVRGGMCTTLPRVPNQPNV